MHFQQRSHRTIRKALTQSVHLAQIHRVHWQRFCLPPFYTVRRLSSAVWLLRGRTHPTTPQSQMVEPEEKFSHTHREPERSPKSLPGLSSLLHPREPREFNALNWFAALSGLSHQESNGDRTHVAYITGSSPLPFWFPIDLASLLRNRILLSLDPGEKDFRRGAVTSHALLSSVGSKLLSVTSELLNSQKRIIPLPSGSRSKFERVFLTLLKGFKILQRSGSVLHRSDQIYKTVPRYAIMLCLSDI